MASVAGGLKGFDQEGSAACSRPNNKSRQEALNLHARRRLRLAHPLQMIGEATSLYKSVMPASEDAE